MTAVLSTMNTLLLVLQKKEALLVDIQCSVDLKLDKFCKLAEGDPPDKDTNIMGPTKSYYTAYQEYIDILTDFEETQKSLFFQSSSINIQNFHYSVVTNTNRITNKRNKGSI